jgi:hypothetical protein
MSSVAKTDEDFIARVCRTSVVVWAFGAMAAWCVAGPYAALGWTFGSAISVGLLAAIDWMVRRTMRPGDARAGKKLMKAAALHWPIILMLLAGAVYLSGRRVAYIVAFVAGLGLAQAVIVLKAVGQLLVERMNKA